MEPEKPGWLTSEFWRSIGSGLAAFVPFLAGLGVLPSGTDAQALSKSIVLAVAAIGAAIIEVVALWRYVSSRTDVKVAKVEMQAQLQMQRMQMGSRYEPHSQGP